MDSALAKKLLSIGFPLVEMQKESFSVREGEGHVCYMCGSPVIEVDGKFYIEPSLDMLIIACGDRLHAVQKGSWKGEGKWMACENLFDKEEGRGRPQEPVGVGENPKEAVINLLASVKTS